MTEERELGLAGKVIAMAMKVHRVLGRGFLESVSENALALELERAGLDLERQKSLRVIYDGEILGEFVADMVVEGGLIIELKAVTALATAHEVQLVTCLTATGIEDGRLLNFGAASLEFKRKYRTCQRPGASKAILPIL